MAPRRSHLVLVGSFLAMLAGMPVFQSVWEWTRGQTPLVLDLFRQPPTHDHLRAFERSLDEANHFASITRPALQGVRFRVLRDGGDKVVVAPGGWLFYGPGLTGLSQRPKTGESTASQAIAAARAFRDDLAARGIRLVVVPVPNKESVYPDRLSARARPPDRPIQPETREFLASCAADGIEVVDLFEVFRRARAAGGSDLFLRQDTHWSPHGLRLAAEAVAVRVGQVRASSGPTRTVDLTRHGDLVRMLRSPAVESMVGPEAVTALLPAGPPDSPPSEGGVLVIGDSFLRVFEEDEPTGAGFPSHLADCLGQTVGRLVVEGGGSTLVRQQLARQPARLAGVRTVVWEFAERELRLGVEGWQIVPVPPRDYRRQPDLQ